MAVNFTSIHIPYSDTKILSQCIEDYLSGDEAIVSFSEFSPDLNGIKAAIEQRKQKQIGRKVLVERLKAQYNGIEHTKEVFHHIDLLLSENTFTVCTAHQPNLFTGPLYFIYKIVHAIRLAESLQTSMPEYKFVPVYYMGSEDADLEELGKAVVDGKKYVWNTKQQGAVGRMLVDKPLVQLLDELYQQLGVNENGKSIVSVFKAAYQLGSSISDATRRVVHHLFGKYGLIVLNPDDSKLKSIFLPIAEKELKEGFSAKALDHTLNQFPEKYKVQTAGRPINLFYLVGDARKRIDQEGDRFLASDLSFDLSGLMEDYKAHPERCSPNVVLRPLFQEMILPNVAFIGGGGELAYWLELKSVFKAVNIPYPVLILRNSYAVIHPLDVKTIESLELQLPQLFEKIHLLEKWLVQKQEGDSVEIQKEIDAMKAVYASLVAKAEKADPTLTKHTLALESKAVDKVLQLEKKMVAAYKRKHAVEINRLHRLKETYFPNGGLQERTENLSGMFAKYGDSFIDSVYKHALALEMEFTVLLAE